MSNLTIIYSKQHIEVGIPNPKANEVLFIPEAISIKPHWLEDPKGSSLSLISNCGRVYNTDVYLFF